MPHPHLFCAACNLERAMQKAALAARLDREQDAREVTHRELTLTLRDLRRTSPSEQTTAERLLARFYIRPR